MGKIFPLFPLLCSGQIALTAAEVTVNKCTDNQQLLSVKSRPEAYLWVAGSKLGEKTTSVPL